MRTINSCFFILLFFSHAVKGSIPAHYLSVGSYRVKHSIAVHRVKDGKSLYSHGADNLLNPASLTKLITTAASLSNWGSTHSFRTDVYYTGKRIGSKIDGNLVVVGGGDPYLVSEKMWPFAAHIKNRGIRTITGRILVDNGLFATEKRQAVTGKNAYDAPLSALGINFNTVAIIVSPAMHKGSAARVRQFPFALDSVRLVDRGVKTASSTSVSAVTSRVLAGGGMEIKVAGQISHRREPLIIYRSIVGDPVAISRDYVKGFLATQGVKVLGKRLSVGHKRKHLHSIKGYPLRFIIKGLNTFSNNYIADMLVKKLGTNQIASGESRLVSYMQQKVGVDTNFKLHKGSGLSVHNRLNARQLAKLLQHVGNDMRLFPDFIASLPASGLEGTIAQRLRKYTGLIRLKTATLTSPVSVSGIAGYYQAPKHGLVAFVIISNGLARHPQPPVSTLRARQDRLLEHMMGG